MDETAAKIARTLVIGVPGQNYQASRIAESYTPVFEALRRIRRGHEHEFDIHGEPCWICSVADEVLCSR